MEEQSQREGENGGTESEGGGEWREHSRRKGTVGGRVKVVGRESEEGGEWREESQMEGENERNRVRGRVRTEGTESEEGRMRMEGTESKEGEQWEEG